MTPSLPSHPSPARSPSWKWWVCGLLLLATMLNYMDRLTLNLMSARILDTFQLDAGHYGQLESAFAFAFALGAIIAGWMADRWNVRWIYPAAVLAWSAAGFATGLANGFYGLLVGRFFLGLAEAGNWPCALRTTQRILPPEERTLGNSLLQSGAAVGAILTPLIILVLVPWTDTWRYPFLVIGAMGIFWAYFWLRKVHPTDLALKRVAPAPSLISILGVLIALLGLDVTVRVAAAHSESLAPSLQELVRARWLGLAVKTTVSGLGIASVLWWLLHATRDDTVLPRPVFVRRFLVVMVIAVSVNITWHYFRAWLPLFLQKQLGYSESFTSWFMLNYYVATVLGSLAAGTATLALARRGLPVHWSRFAVFLACALLATFSLLAAVLPAGARLLAVLLVIGFAALGLFPVLYSLSQELTVRHQGKVSGSLGCINWLAMYLLHEVVGESVKGTGSYSRGLGLAGLAPLAGVAALALFWGKMPRAAAVAGQAGAADSAGAPRGPVPAEVAETQKGLAANRPADRQESDRAS